MNQDNLRDHIAKLRAELAEADPADPAHKQSLSDALQDAHRLIGQTHPAAADRSLPDRLEQIAVQFEAGHPTLAASARRLVELLGEVGI
jgi:signal transduction histidine kinase